MMRRLWAIVGGLALVLTIGVGVASAAPDNKNTISWPITCDGQVYTLTYNSGSASFRSDGATLELMGATRDGQWVVPLVPGQSTKDLTVCTYTFFGHDDAIYVQVTSTK
jgi:hypothetical protein